MDSDLSDQAAGGLEETGKRGSPPAQDEDLLAERVGQQARRKLKARRNGTQDVWFGLGMMGLIGWSVALPTLAGAALGIWLDTHHAGAHSWTLGLLLAGLVVGCLNAWHWVDRQDKAMRDEEVSGDA